MYISFFALCGCKVAHFGKVLGIMSTVTMTCLFKNVLYRKFVTYACHSEHSVHRGEEEVEESDGHQSVHRGTEPRSAPQGETGIIKPQFKCRTLRFLSFTAADTPDYAVTKTDYENQDSSQGSFERGEQLGENHSSQDCENRNQNATRRTRKNKYGQNPSKHVWP